MKYYLYYSQEHCDRNGHRIITMNNGEQFMYTAMSDDTSYDQYKFKDKQLVASIDYENVKHIDTKHLKTCNEIPKHHEIKDIESLRKKYMSSKDVDFNKLTIK